MCLLINKTIKSSFTIVPSQYNYIGVWYIQFTYKYKSHVSVFFLFLWSPGCRHIKGHPRYRGARAAPLKRHKIITEFLCSFISLCTLHCGGFVDLKPFVAIFFFFSFCLSLWLFCLLVVALCLFVVVLSFCDHTSILN